MSNDEIDCKTESSGKEEDERKGGRLYEQTSGTLRLFLPSGLAPLSFTD